jgi:hypothetical protein
VLLLYWWLLQKFVSIEGFLSLSLSYVLRMRLCNMHFLATYLCPVRTDVPLAERTIREQAAKRSLESLLSQFHFPSLIIWNSISADAFALIISLVSSPASHLRSLHFKNYPLSPPQLASLLSALCDGSSLTDLDISGTPIDQGGLQQVAEVLLRNTSLVSLKLQDAGVTDAGATLLATSLESVGLLRSCPQYISTPSLDLLVMPDVIRRIRRCGSSA